MNDRTSDFDVLCQRHKQLRTRYDQLEGVRRLRVEEVKESCQTIPKIVTKLTIGQRVGQVLDELAKDAYEKLLQTTAKLLTSALHDVLGQNLQVTSKVTYDYDATNVSFGIQRDNREEDLLRGQGGSVANIVSTGLRLLALASLPKDKHRPFIVLDEQDCWLQPAIVPRFVQLVHSAAKQLGFQVLMISHHDPESFVRYVD